MADLAERGRRLGVPAGVSDLQWPYGPNVYIDMRQRMVEWAERHGLTYAPGAPRCVDWPRFGRCRHDGHTWVGWLDHVTAWKRDGQPAVLLAQPYVLDDNDIAALVELAGDSRLFVDVDPAHGWYGGGTRPVAIWRRPDTAPVVDWDGQPGHAGDSCVHCSVCDACGGSGQVCRVCGLCVEHAEQDRARRQAQFDQALTAIETDPGYRYLDAPAREHARTVAWLQAFYGLGLTVPAVRDDHGLPCAHLRQSTRAQRVPGTNRWHKPLRTYMSHSLYDAATGRWT